MPTGRGNRRRREGLNGWIDDLVFHAVGFAFNNDRFGLVKEAVQDGGGDASIVVKDGGPLFIRFIRGQDDRAAFVALADDLEEQIGADFIHGDIAEFIENEHRRRDILGHLSLQLVSGLSGDQVIDRVDCGGEEDRVTGLTRGVSKSGG